MTVGIIHFFVGPGSSLHQGLLRSDSYEAVAAGHLPLVKPYSLQLMDYSISICVIFFLDHPELGLAKPTISRSFPAILTTLHLTFKKAHRSFSGKVDGSEIGVVYLNVMNTHNGEAFFPVGGTSPLCLDRYGVFFFFASIGIASSRACIASASVLCTTPGGKQIRRPHFDAAQTSELCLCEKHFWRDIGRSYFGARAQLG